MLAPQSHPGYPEQDQASAVTPEEVPIPLWACRCEHSLCPISPQESLSPAPDSKALLEWTFLSRFLGAGTSVTTVHWPGLGVLLGFLNQWVMAGGLPYMIIIGVQVPRKPFLGMDASTASVMT